MKTIRANRVTHCVATAIFASTLCGQAVQAQPDNSGPQQIKSALDEIVITARRREENLQQTPVAVTALTAGDLETAQINTMLDLQRMAPNLAVTNKSPGGSAYGYVTIRGQTNNQIFLVNDPAIGVYVDGVYMGHSPGQLTNFFDLERAEVLRGPQGTLFGRNTTGGAVSLTTNKPEGTFGGLVRAGGGSHSQWELAGVLNVPLKEDEYAVRFAAQHRENGGLIRDRFRGVKTNDSDDEVYRISFRATPEGTPLELLLSGYYNNHRDSGAGPVVIAVRPGSPIANFAATNPIPDRSIEDFLQSNNGFYDSFTDTDAYSDVSVKGVTGTISWEFGSATLKSISNYQKVDLSVLSDFEATPYPYISYFNAQDQKQFSEELQISGDADRLSYIGGLYYFDEKGAELSLLPSPATGLVSQSLANVKNRSYASYGQLSFAFTDRLSLTAGVRYTWDKRKVVLNNLRNVDEAPTGYANPPTDTIANCANGFPNNGTTLLGQNDGPNDPFVLCQLTLSKKFDYPSYLLSLEYEASDDVFLYAKTSRSSLAGGWNARAGAPALSFNPENATDAEIGAKIDWFDRRLRTNIALFYTWNTDLQRSTFNIVDGILTSYLLNAGKGHVYGFEMDAVAVPWAGMELTATLGLAKASYDKFSETKLGVSGPYTLDRSGEKFPGVPAATWSVGATQNLPTAFGVLKLHLDYNFMGRIAYYDLTPDIQQAPATVDIEKEQKRLSRASSYGVLNGRMSFDIEEYGVELAAWVRNITNEKYYTRMYPNPYTSVGVAAAFTGDPRTAGFTITAKF